MAHMCRQITGSAASCAGWVGIIVATATNDWVRTCDYTVATCVRMDELGSRGLWAECVISPALYHCVALNQILSLPDLSCPDDLRVPDGPPCHAARAHVDALRQAAERHLRHQAAPRPRGRRPLHPHRRVWHHIDCLVPHRRSPRGASDVVWLLPVRRLGWLRSLSPGWLRDLVLPRHRPVAPEQREQLLLLQTGGHGHVAGPPRQPRQECTGVKDVVLRL